MASNFWWGRHKMINNTTTYVLMRINMHIITYNMLPERSSFVWFGLTLVFFKHKDIRRHLPHTISFHVVIFLVIGCYIQDKRLKGKLKLKFINFQFIKIKFIFINLKFKFIKFKFNLDKLEGWAITNCTKFNKVKYWILLVGQGNPGHRDRLGNKRLQKGKWGSVMKASD